MLYPQEVSSNPYPEPNHRIAIYFFKIRPNIVFPSAPKSLYPVGLNLTNRPHDLWDPEVQYLIYKDPK
jgi:hypothetical protein